MRPSPTVSLRCLAWSPDALRLICQGVDSARANSAGLYSVRVSDGAGLQRVTTYTGGGNDVPGAFSPDGSRIAFVRQTYMVVSLGQLWVCDVDGSNARKITDTLTGYDVSWSPDGRWIAGDANGALLLFDLTNLGSPPTTITFSRGSASQPRWSPDGTHLVFQFVRSGGTGPEVYVANVDGSDLHQLTTGPKPDTSPDWGRTP
jgi:Tol biopolymer transport system component